MKPEWRPFRFLGDDRPEIAYHVARVDPAKHDALAAELALAFFAGRCDGAGAWLSERREALQDAAKALRKAERALKRAGWPHEVNGVPGDVGPLRVLVEAEAAQDDTATKLALAMPVYYWPASVRVETKLPASWRPIAVRRVRALGIGRPTASKLVDLAAETGQHSKGPLPAVVMAAVTRATAEREPAMLVDQPKHKRSR